MRCKCRRSAARRHRRVAVGLLRSSSVLFIISAPNPSHAPSIHTSIFTLQSKPLNAVEFEVLYCISKKSHRTNQKSVPIPSNTKAVHSATKRALFAGKSVQSSRRHDGNGLVMGSRQLRLSWSASAAAIAAVLEGLVAYLARRYLAWCWKDPCCDVWLGAECARTEDWFSAGVWG